MTHFAFRLLAFSLASAVAVATLCFGGRDAHAQAAPVSYWLPGWTMMGFGGMTSGSMASGSAWTNGQGAETYGNFPSFDGRGGVDSRDNLPKGWFMGSRQMALSGMDSGYGSFGSLSVSSTQFGYNFKNSPVTVFGGFDSLKFDNGIGSGFTPLDASTSGYTARAGVEFRPAANVSLSLGASFTQQQTTRSDSQVESLSLSGGSPYELVGHH